MREATGWAAEGPAACSARARGCWPRSDARACVTGVFARTVVVVVVQPAGMMMPSTPCWYPLRRCAGWIGAAAVIAHIWDQTVFALGARLPVPPAHRPRTAPPHRLKTRASG